MTEEEYLRKQLADLEASYRKAAEPIIKRLAAIEAKKPPKPFIVPSIAPGQASSL